MPVGAIGGPRVVSGHPYRYLQILVTVRLAAWKATPVALLKLGALLPQAQARVSNRLEWPAWERW